MSDGLSNQSSQGSSATQGTQSLGPAVQPQGAVSQPIEQGLRGPGQPGDSNGGSSPRVPAGFNRDFALQCEGYIEEYRARRVEKAVAIEHIFKALRLEEGRLIGASEEDRRLLPGADQISAAGVAYVNMLDEVDRDRRDAAEDARARATQEVTVNAGDESTGEGRQAAEGVQAGKRARSEDDAAGGDYVRRRLDESIIPFVNDDDATPLTASLQRTLQLKENYLRDLSAAKNLVLSAPACPGIPQDLWRAVLGGMYVDLSKVYSGVNSSEGDKQDLQTIGGYEISLSSVRGPAKRVTTHGEWSIAWGRYAKAVTFAYPHRAQELREYEDYVIEMFGGYKNFPERVIALDAAIRTKVARVNNLLLTDLSKFHGLYCSNIIAPGAGASRGNAEASSSKPTKTTRYVENPDPTICRRYNTSGCRSRDCNYRHVCLDCGAVDHVLPNCGKAGGARGATGRAGGKH